MLILLPAPAISPSLESLRFEAASLCTGFAFLSEDRSGRSAVIMGCCSFLSLGGGADRKLLKPRRMRSFGFDTGHSVGCLVHIAAMSFGRGTTPVTFGKRKGLVKTIQRVSRLSSLAGVFRECAKEFLLTVTCWKSSGDDSFWTRSYSVLGNVVL